MLLLLKVFMYFTTSERLPCIQQETRLLHSKGMSGCNVVKDFTIFICCKRLPYILLLEVTMYSYYKKYAKKGSHKCVLHILGQQSIVHGDPGYCRPLLSEVTMHSRRNHGTKWYSCEWLICIQGFSYMVLLIKVTMYSYFKGYAKNGIHKLQLLSKCTAHTRSCKILLFKN